MASKDIIPEAEILDPQECWRLLGEASVGRLAVIVEDHPDVFPVTYKVDNESLLFRTGTGTKQQALDTGAPVALEADRVSAEFGMAWSVVVKGRAERATSTDQTTDAVRRALFPWQGIGKDYLVRIVPESVTGRRFTLTPSMWTTTLDDETRAGIEE
jgi:nitroimidazol reductase NimA-like FMN-containing flavoprotein (pyridoxamine 5'-phosphate oxidase superfamily)